MNSESSNLFIISGPSCAGEDSVIEGLRSHMKIERVITTRTREMRPGESQGNPYYFITTEEFEAGIARGDYVEYTRQYDNKLSGVTRQELARVQALTDTIGIWKIEWQGVQKAKALFPGIPAILVAVHDLETLRRRMIKRDNPTPEFLADRMAYTEEWMKHTDIYDHIIWNDDGKLHESIADAERYIRAHSTIA